jgi:60 kDa SS-A/Ro ribonucleoprotein
VRAVKRIAEISRSGRAPKNDPALFSLALCASFGNNETKKAAFEALPEVARIGTHLFHFVSYISEFRGWGRSLKQAIQRWYTNMPYDRLTEQFLKYQQRDGWSHRDLLRLSHLQDKEREALYRWVTCKGNLDERTIKRYQKDKKEIREDRYPKIEQSSLPDIIKGYQELFEIDASIEEGKEPSKKSIDIVSKIIFDNQMTREMVPTKFLNYPEVWESLFEKMPMTAMIRNLATMTKVGFLEPLSKPIPEVCKILTNMETLKKSRIHPIQILSALLTYSQGHGMRGKGEWNPVQPIVDSLDKAFYLSFGNVEPTGKNIYFGVDISGSMDGGEISGVPGLTPRIGAAAMSLITAAVEKNYYMAGFCHKMEPLKISPRMRLDNVVKVMEDMDMGRTDCSLPILDAQEKGMEIDAFIILTDSETWSGRIHPVQALKNYRNKTGIPAKMIVVGMVSNGFTIADPNDGGMMDVVGFDTATPQLMSDFIRE